MQRICNSIALAGYDVMLVGKKVKTSTHLPSFSFTCKRITCWFNKGVAFYIEYNLRLFFFLLFTKADAFCAIDLDTILPNYLVSAIKNKKRVYDAHELFTEQKEIVTRPFIHTIWLAIEKFCVPKFTNGYTVNAFIKEELARRYKVNYGIIRNMPVEVSEKGEDRREKVEGGNEKIEDRIEKMEDRREKVEDRSEKVEGGNEKIENRIEKTEDRSEKVEGENDKSKIGNQQFIIYQGAVNEGRSFETLIPAMKQVNMPLLICGEGNFYEQTKALIAKHHLQSKIILKGYVAPDELKAITPTALFGLTLFEKTGLNQYYSLSNRFFDYVMAGIPQICVGYPEYKFINDKYEIALLIDDVGEQTIANAMNKLLTDVVLYKQLQHNCIKARAFLNWSEEEKTLIAFWNNVFESS